MIVQKISRSLAKDTTEVREDLSQVVDQLGHLVASSNAFGVLKPGVIVAGSLCRAYDHLWDLTEEVRKDSTISDKEHYFGRIGIEIANGVAKKIIDTYL